MPVVLPHRYRFAHAYAIFLHDLIVGRLKSAVEAEVFKTHIPLTENQAETFNQLDGEALYSWLEENFDPKVVREIDYKTVVPALVSDFCHYVLEALNNSRKGKLTVTFTLLRKPFQDSLFYLEWKLADLPDFLNRFRHGTAKDLSVKHLSVERRKEIIREAIAALPMPHRINPEFIYDVRYNRAERYSLAGLSDQAIHLITTKTHLATTPKNFNFIFSNDEQLESQWHTLYLVVPQLLYHALCVSDAIMSGLARWDKGWDIWVRVRRDVGLLLYMDSMTESAVDAVGIARESLRALLTRIAPACPQCGNELPLHLRNMRQLCVRGMLRCPICRDTVVFDYESTSADE